MAADQNRDKGKWFETLRFRLTFLFVVSLGVVSLLVLTYLLHGIRQSHLSELDRRMEARMEEVAGMIDNEAVYSDSSEASQERQTLDDQAMAAIAAQLEDGSDSNFAGGELFVVFSNDRHFFKMSNHETWDDLDADDCMGILNEASHGSNISIPDLPGRYRVATLQRYDLYSLTLMVSLSELDREFAATQTRFYAAAGVLMLMGGLLCWWVVARSMKGVEVVSDAAARLGLGELESRVAWKGKGSEIERLADSFNAMAEQIEVLIGEMKDVTNNVAHDLRTPVTRMRLIAENALNTETDIGRDLAATVIEECERQSAIIEDVLSLSESESGVLQLNRSDVMVNEVLEDIADLYHSAAADSGCALRLQAPVPVEAFIDKHRFQRAVANLVDNAIKYSEGEVRIELEAEDNGFSIRIRDEGAGVPSSMHEEIFKRFTRGDASRHTEGSGLGLSLARAYMRSHGGDIVLEASESGACFCIRMPA